MGFFEDLQKILVDFETSIMAEVKEEIAEEFAIMEEKPSSEYVVPYMNVQNINGTLKDMDGKLLSAGKFANRTLSQLKAEILKDVALPETGIVDIFKDGSALALYQFDGNSGDAENIGNIEYTTGKFGQGINYINKTKDDYINCGTIERKGSKEISISGWFKCDDLTSSWQNIWHLTPDNEDCSGNSRQPALWFGDDNENKFHIKNDGTSTNNLGNGGNGSINIGEWNHIVQTVSLREIKLFVNGELVDTFNSDEDLKFNDGILYIGDKWYTKNYLIDQVRVFNKVLSSDEINKLFSESDTLKQNFSTISQIDLFSDGSALELIHFSDAGKVLSYSGDTWQGGSENIILGKVGNAMTFDGSSSQKIYLDTGYGKSGVITVSLFVKFNNFDGWNTFITAPTNFDGEHIIAATHDTSWATYNPTTYTDIDTNVFKIDEWIHIVVEQNYDTGKIKFTANKQLVHNVDIHDSEIGGFGGDKSGDNEGLDGALCQIRVFNKSLTDNEIKKLFEEK